MIKDNILTKLNKLMKIILISETSVLLCFLEQWFILEERLIYTLKIKRNSNWLKTRIKSNNKVNKLNLKHLMMNKLQLWNEFKRKSNKKYFY